MGRRGAVAPSDHRPGEVDGLTPGTVNSRSAVGTVHPGQPGDEPVRLRALAFCFRGCFCRLQTVVFDSAGFALLYVLGTDRHEGHKADKGNESQGE